MSIKQNIISIIQKMPSNSTIDDIMEYLYIKQKVLKGQKQLENGQFHTHQEVKQISKGWQI